MYKNITSTRQYLTEKYIPSLSGSLLFVGVGPYTKDYHLINSEIEFITIDYLQEREIYGSPMGHYVDDFLKFNPKRKFNHICLFGVLGHEKISKNNNKIKYNMQSIEDVLQKCNQLLEENGTILLGPSYIRVADKYKEYWILKFSELDNKYDYLDKYICPCNIVIWITPITTDNLKLNIY